MLAIAEKNIIPKLYLFTEHLKIKSYEKKLKNSDGILSISQKDHEHFNKIGNSHYIKAFHPNKMFQVRQARRICNLPWQPVGS